MAKEDKELVERLGKEWGIFWISEGLDVYHRNDFNQDWTLKKNATLMTVDKILKVPVKTKSDIDPQPYRIKGVACHWMKNGDYKTGRFHTKELFPAKVVKEKMLLDWLDRHVDYE